MSDLLAAVRYTSEVVQVRVVALLSTGWILSCEPGEVDLVLGVIAHAVGHAHREAEAHHWVTGLQEGSAPILRSGRRQPGIDSVIDERVVQPLLDFVAEAVDVLDVGERIARV